MLEHWARCRCGSGSWDRPPPSTAGSPARSSERSSTGPGRRQLSSGSPRPSGDPGAPDQGQHRRRRATTSITGDQRPAASRIADPASRRRQGCSRRRPRRRARTPTRSCSCWASRGTRSRRPTPPRASTSSRHPPDPRQPAGWCSSTSRPPPSDSSTRATALGLQAAQVAGQRSEHLLQRRVVAHDDLHRHPPSAPGRGPRPPGRPRGRGRARRSPPADSGSGGRIASQVCTARVAEETQTWSTLVDPAGEPTPRRSRVPADRAK